MYFSFTLEMKVTAPYYLQYLHGFNCLPFYFEVKDLMKRSHQKGCLQIKRKIEQK